MYMYIDAMDTTNLGVEYGIVRGVPYSRIVSDSLAIRVCKVCIKRTPNSCV